MSKPKSVTFGKRSSVATTLDTKPTTTAPWLAWGLAGFLACALGAAALTLLAPVGTMQTDAIASQPGTEERMRHAEAVAAEFLRLERERPDELKQYALSGIEACLPSQAMDHWMGAETKALAVDSYVKTLSLQSQDLSPEQRDREFREWFLPVASKLPESQQPNFRGLMENGLNDPNTRSCVASAIQRSMRS